MDLLDAQPPKTRAVTRLTCVRTGRLDLAVLECNDGRVDRRSAQPPCSNG